jgi:hypothetical protein
MIFFEPQQRDRKLFPHDLFKALVVPRPIGWSEFTHARLDTAPSRLVKPPRVAGSSSAA